MRGIMRLVARSSQIPGVLSQWQYLDQQRLVSLLVLGGGWPSTNAERKSRLSNSPLPFVLQLPFRTALPKSLADVSVCGMTLQMAASGQIHEFLRVPPPPSWGEREVSLWLGQNKKQIMSLLFFKGLLLHAMASLLRLAILVCMT